MNKKIQIRNSTAEFLIFQLENKEEGIEVLYQDETLWLTQDATSEGTLLIENKYKDKEIHSYYIVQLFNKGNLIIVPLSVNNLLSAGVINTDNLRL